MSQAPKIIGFLKIGTLLSLWNLLYVLDKEKLEASAFNKGVSISQKFKKYPAWDAIAEPLIMKQFSTFFTVGNSFISGLISDNSNKDQLQKDLECICKKKD